MSRPQKNTIDYFSHDSDASDGKTLTILFNHFGHEGLSAWWLLLEIVSKTRNHVIGIRNPETFEYLAAKMHFKPERLREILQKMADLEAIDKPLFVSGYIWCQNFVDRQEPVYKSRSKPLPTKPELSVEETPLSVEETPLIAPISTQSKDSKVKIVKNTIALKKTYGEFKNVLLTDDEHEKLRGRFNSLLPAMLEELSIGIASKGYKYKDHYATILSWAAKKEREGKNDNGIYRGNPSQKPAGAFADIDTKED